MITKQEKDRQSFQLGRVCAKGFGHLFSLERCHKDQDAPTFTNSNFRVFSYRTLQIIELYDSTPPATRQDPVLCLDPTLAAVDGLPEPSKSPPAIPVALHAPLLHASAI
jgi:hypothetical protein